MLRSLTRLTPARRQLRRPQSARDHAEQCLLIRFYPFWCSFLALCTPMLGRVARIEEINGNRVNISEKLSRWRSYGVRTGAGQGVRNAGLSDVALVVMGD
jgi:hypothetical protein